MHVHVGKPANGIGHVIKRQYIFGDKVDRGRFTSPKLQLNNLGSLRTQSGRAFEAPLSEIIELGLTAS